ncbi:hypothetical protein SNE40_023431 [Patella caerulea]|uniref:EF-hand domain-containing protein n=1 Tax=Patella caerulea TaxID=87958 RepID=A0AAN8G367_PATCE
MGLTAEQKKAYTQFFQQADCDGNGHLTKVELHTIITKQLKLKLSDAEIMEMFSGVDGNADGIVTLDEYLNEMGKVPAKDLQRADFERIFESIDKDGSRTLDAGEVQKLFEQCGHQVSGDDLDKIISQLDKDGDGKINIDEFLKLF